MIYIGDGDTREQRMGVWVAWMAENVAGFGNFHNFSEIHDSQPMADVFDNQEVVGNKEIGQI